MRGKKAIEDDKLTWKHISDLQHWNNGAAGIYGIKAIPQNVLVDPNGIIVARNLHGDDLRKKLEEILKIRQAGIDNVKCFIRYIRVKHFLYDGSRKYPD